MYIYKYMYSYIYIYYVCVQLGLKILKLFPSQFLDSRSPASSCHL